MDLEETVLSTERIFEGKVVKLRVDTVRLPSGRESRREVIEHGGAACIVPMQDAETVVLIRQFRLPAGKILLEVPAGKIDSGETPEVCAARELAEEINQAPGQLIPLYQAYLAPGYSSEKMYGYLALEMHPAVKDADLDEAIELVPMSLTAALAAISSGEIEDAKTIAALTLAERYLRKG